jgi:hypothetical protein
LQEGSLARGSSVRSVRREEGEEKREKKRREGKKWEKFPNLKISEKNKR